VFRYSDVSAWLTWSQVRQEIRAGRWRRVHRGIYVAHNGPVSRQQERRICLLAAPPGSALAGLTAAELDGLEGFSVNDAYLVVPAGLRCPERPGLITKLSHWLGPEDVHPAREWRAASSTVPRGAHRTTTPERSSWPACNTGWFGAPTCATR